MTRSALALLAMYLTLKCFLRCNYSACVIEL